MIYTLGYSGWSMEAVASVLDRLDATLVDVRMSPYSRAADWNGKALAGRLGDRYIWLKEFGNRNYRGSIDQVDIVDFPAGEAKLRQLGRPVVLMCGCADVNACHRKQVAERLAQQWHTRVEHLEPGTKL